MSVHVDTPISRAALLRRCRQEHALSRDALAIRAGRTHAQIAALEDGSEPLTAGELARLLSVLGEDLTRDDDGRLGTLPRAHPFDAGQIARQAALPIARRVELALAWNDFAQQISRGRHQPAPPQPPR